MPDNPPARNGRHFTWNRKQKLLEQVNEYHFVKGWSMVNVARALDMPLGTVHNYVNLLKKMRRDTVEKNQIDYFGLKDWIAKLTESYNEIIKQAWNQYTLSQTPKERMACLDRISQAEKDRFYMLQSMGVAPKAKESEQKAETVTYKSMLKGDVEEKKIETIRTDSTIETKPPENTNEPIKL